MSTIDDMKNGKKHVISSPESMLVHHERLRGAMRIVLDHISSDLRTSLPFNQQDAHQNSTQTSASNPSSYQSPPSLEE